jgi:hypothetical protein
MPIQVQGSKLLCFDGQSRTREILIPAVLTQRRRYLARELSLAGYRAGRV